MKRLFILALFAAPFVAGPATAQDAVNDSVNMVIIYGDDACPVSDGDEIVVCQRMDEGERFRIPEILRQSDSPDNIPWTNRVRSLETVGARGIMSCSPEGPGGYTGCTQQMIDTAYREKEGASDVRFGQLIEQEREARMETIDADAAAEQARVEEIERAYMQRLEAERSAPLPGDETPLPAPDGQ